MLCAAHAQPAALFEQVSGAVRAEQLQGTVSTLVGFGTRHTLSDTASDTRGIGAAHAPPHHDWFFGVSAVSAEGYESPVVFPGDAGSF